MLKGSDVMRSSRSTQANIPYCRFKCENELKHDAVKCDTLRMTHRDGDMTRDKPLEDGRKSAKISKISRMMRSILCYLVGLDEKEPTEEGKFESDIVAERGREENVVQIDATPTPKVIKRKKKIVIIGAGISGLACAKELFDCGEKDFVILEASDEVGGRIRTDEVDGYLLDRGFQVFIERYPESENLFDYGKLNLKQFLPGALVRFENELHVVSDPFRRPQDIYSSITSPIGSFADKLKVGIFSVLVRLKNINDIFEETDEPLSDHLVKTKGLSESIIQRFFSPFYQGIFLSPLNLQSSRMFNFVFKMFTEGAASLPTGGQLA